MGDRTSYQFMVDATGTQEVLTWTGSTAECLFRDNPCTEAWGRRSADKQQRASEANEKSWLFRAGKQAVCEERSRWSLVERRGGGKCSATCRMRVYADTSSIRGCVR